MEFDNLEVCVICSVSVRLKKSDHSQFINTKKIFNDCLKYLHCAIIGEYWKDVLQTPNKQHLSLCKNCSDSAMQLTQLHEQLTKLHKKISDLTVVFSLAVLYRKNQAKTMTVNEEDPLSSGPNLKNEMMDLNVADLPFYLFDSNSQNCTVKQNIEEANDLQDMDVPDANIVKCEKTESGDENQSSDCPEDAETDDLFTKFLSGGEQFELDSENVEIDTLQGNDVNVDFNTIAIEADETSFAQENKNSSSISIESTHYRPNLKEPDLSDRGATNPVNSVNDGKNSNLKGPKSVPNASTSKSQHQSAEKKEAVETIKFNYFNCSYCVMNFRSQTALQIHEKVHTGGKQFKCTECDKAFNRPNHLIIHQRTHTGERPYKCSFCEKAFYRTSHLRDHERLHTGEKPFKCLVCEMRFKDSSSRARHQRTHTLVG